MLLATILLALAYDPVSISLASIVYQLKDKKDFQLQCTFNNLKLNLNELRSAVLTDGSTPRFRQQHCGVARSVYVMQVTSLVSSFTV